jgi:hypothetical protein
VPSNSIQLVNVSGARVTAGLTIRARAMSFTDHRLVRSIKSFCKFEPEVKSGPSVRLLEALATAREERGHLELLLEECKWRNLTRRILLLLQPRAS